MRLLSGAAMDSIEKEMPGDWTAAPEAHPEVIENYAGYTPPFNVKALTEKLIASVPSRYLHGLSRVVLTNAGELPRKLRRKMTKSRGKKVRIRTARGLYHQAWHGKPAWIEIYVDNTLSFYKRGVWRLLLYLAYFRESELGKVLFHEVGHHIDATVRPEFRESEDIADDWSTKLGRDWFRKNHPFLRWVLRRFTPVIRQVAILLNRRLLRDGKISRTEFEKRVRKLRSK